MSTGGSPLQVETPGLGLPHSCSRSAFPPDVDVPQPDEKSIITYVSSLYDVMPRVPEVSVGIKANVSMRLWRPRDFGAAASLGLA